MGSGLGPPAPSAARRSAWGARVGGSQDDLAHAGLRFVMLPPGSTRQPSFCARAHGRPRNRRRSRELKAKESTLSLGRMPEAREGHSATSPRSTPSPSGRRGPRAGGCRALEVQCGSARPRAGAARGPRRTAVRQYLHYPSIVLCHRTNVAGIVVERRDVLRPVARLPGGAGPATAGLSNIPGDVVAQLAQTQLGRAVGAAASSVRGVRSRSARRASHRADPRPCDYGARFGPVVATNVPRAWSRPVRTARVMRQRHRAAM